MGVGVGVGVGLGLGEADGEGVAAIAAELVSTAAGGAVVQPASRPLAATATAHPRAVIVRAFVIRAA